MLVPRQRSGGTKRVRLTEHLAVALRLLYGVGTWDVVRLSHIPKQHAHLNGTGRDDEKYFRLNQTATDCLSTTKLRHPSLDFLALTLVLLMVLLAAAAAAAAATTAEDR